MYIYIYNIYWHCPSFQAHRAGWLTLACMAFALLGETKRPISRRKHEVVATIKEKHDVKQLVGLEAALRCRLLRPF